MAVRVPYTITLQRASGKGFTVQDNFPKAMPAGASHTWVGPAVATSDVKVTVLASSQKLTNPTAARFMVTPRNWPQWQLTTLVLNQYLVWNPPGAKTRMTPFPQNNTRLGTFYFEPPQVGDFVPARPTQGPNASVAYLANPLVVNSYVTNLHPALLGNPQNLVPSDTAYKPWHQWYDDQNNVGSGTCLKTNVPQLHANVQRHEGVTQHPVSHFGVANAQFAALRPDTLFEQLYTAKDDAQLIKLAVSTLTTFMKNGGPYRSAQSGFDATDTPLVFSHLIPCTFDLNPVDP
jgi:hypothetical protein